ncbi:MAG: type II toxin-antitoxin system RelE/ParE family toxin [Gemmatimonadales bacterium]
MPAWEVEVTDQWVVWFESLTEAEQDDVAAVVGLVEARGPQLPYPYSSGIAASAHPHMRELRIQSGGQPLRTLYAFDPCRTAILLVGGTKTGDNRWYDRVVPNADRLYTEHLNALRKEKLI